MLRQGPLGRCADSLSRPLSRARAPPPSLSLSPSPPLYSPLTRACARSRLRPRSRSAQLELLRDAVQELYSRRNASGGVGLGVGERDHATRDLKAAKLGGVAAPRGVFG